MSFLAKILEFFASLFGGRKNKTEPQPDPDTTTDKEEPEVTDSNSSSNPESAVTPTENNPAVNEEGGNDPEEPEEPAGPEPLVTKEQLKAILIYAKDSDLDTYFEPINACLHHYEINTPLRIAHFLAQIAHESGCLKYKEEIWNNPQLDANGVARNGNRWQLTYEGRSSLGNTQTGDGYRFRGRGLIQLTGRANYTKYGAFLGRNLTDGTNPDLVGEPGLGTDVAGWYWQGRKLNTYADADDVLKITKRINGGTNGLQDRKKFLALAKKALNIT